MPRILPEEVVIKSLSSALGDIRKDFIADSTEMALAFYDVYKDDMPDFLSTFSDSEEAIKIEEAKNLPVSDISGYEIPDPITNKEIYAVEVNEILSDKFSVTEGFIKYSKDGNTPILSATIIENPGDEGGYVSTFQSPTFKAACYFEVVLRSFIFSLYDGIQIFSDVSGISTSSEEIDRLLPEFGVDSRFNRPRDNEGQDIPLDDLKEFRNLFVKYLKPNIRVKALVGPQYVWEDDLSVHNFVHRVIVKT